MVFLPNRRCSSLICFIADASYNLFSCGNGCEAAFLILLTPQEQLTGSNAMLTGDQLRAHSRLKTLLNNGDFFLNTSPSALLWT